MSVNSAYYTSPTDLKIGLGGQYQLYAEDIVIKVPNFGNSGTVYNSQYRAMSTKAGTDSTALNKEFDSSICYAGVDANCDFIKFTAVQGNIEGGVTTENQSIEASGSLALSYQGNYFDGTTARNSTFSVYTADNYVQYKSTGTSNVWDLAPWGYGYNHTVSTASGNTFAHVVDGNVAPVTKFSTKNFTLGIAVLACKLQNGVAWEDIHYTGSGANGVYTNVSTMCFDLSRYVRDAYTEYPYIIGIYFITFVSGASSTDTDYLSFTNTKMQVFGMGDAVTYNHTFQSADGEVTKKIVKHKHQDSTTLTVYTTDYVTGNNLSYNAYSGYLLWGCNNVSSSSTYMQISYNYCDYYVYGSHGTIKYIASSESAYQSGNFTSCMYYMHYSALGSIDAFEEYCKKQAAYTGLFFIEKIGNITGNVSADYCDTDMYLGTLDSAGIAHGEYTHGTSNKSQQQYDWSDAIEETTYKGSESISDPNTYLDSMSGQTSVNLKTFSRYYFCTDTDISNLQILLQKLYKRTANETLEDYQKRLQETTLNTNPIDNILSLKYYTFPCNLYSMPVSQLETVYVASLAMTDGTTTVLGYTHNSANTLLTLELGYFDIYSVYGDFRDTEPYTTYTLYLPYTNTVTLDSRIINNKSIYIQYKVDMRTASCTAVVSLDSFSGEVIETAHGSLAIDIPVTGVQSADYANAVYQSISNLKSAKIQGLTAGLTLAGSAVGTVVAGATGNVVGVAGGLAGIAGATANIAKSDIAVKTAEYSLDHTPVAYRSVGSASAGDGALMYLYPAIIVTRPVMKSGYVPELYAHTNGFACCINAKLSDFHGLTVAGAVDLSGVNATEDEKNMIENLLKVGVYL